MKVFNRWVRRLLLLLSLLGGLLTTGLAQDQDTVRTARISRIWPWSRPHALKTNVLGPVSLYYERALTRRFALRTGGRWWRYGYEMETSEFVNVTLDAKWYLEPITRLTARPHPTGLYLSPYLKGRYRRNVIVQTSGYGGQQGAYVLEVRSLGFGLLIGYQLLNRRGVIVDVFAGGGVFPAALDHLYKTGPNGGPAQLSRGDFQYQNIDLRTGVNLGWAF